MRFSEFLIRGILCLALSAGALSAQSQSVALLPGPQGTSTTIPVYSADPFGPQTTIGTVPQGVFQILPKPDGTKYYIISNTAGTGVTVVNNNLAQPHQIATSITSAPTLAAISPDGRRLLVIAGGLIHVIDTSFDTVVATLSVTGTPIDIAFSHDSLRGFILSNAITGVSQSAYVTPVDLSLNSLGQALIIPTSGSATGIATAPTGLLYVTALNAIFEINPRNLQRTTDGALIAVNGSPGKPVFTVDGRNAISINETPSTGSLAFIFDLTAKTFNIVSRATQGISRLDRVAIAADARIFAYAKENTTLYEMSLAGGLNQSGLRTSLSTDQVSAFALSNEYPVKNLFLIANASGTNTLYKVDPVSYFMDSNRYTVTTQPGAILQYIGLSPTSGGVSIRAYNTKQTVAAGATSLPLVVRVVDSQSRPVNNALVSFSSTSTVTLTTNTAFTNSDGYAQVYATLPSSPGAYGVQASIANIAIPVTFDLTVPGTGGPCLTNCGPSNLSVESGTGQLISEQGIARQLLMVIAKDASGNPVAGQTVSFSVTQGSGTIQCSGIGDQFDYIPTGSCTSDGLTVTTVTDVTGRAGVKYLSTSIFGQSFAQTVVTATAGTGSVNFIVTTVLVARPNNGGQASLPVAYIVKPEQDVTGYRSLRGGAGQTLPAAIQIQVVAADGPQIGQPIPNVALNVGGIATPGNPKLASCAGGTPLTDVQGIATCDVVLGSVLTPSPVALPVNVGGAIETPLITIQVTQGPPARVVLLQGNTQSGRAGQQFLLRARITDAGGNSSRNVPVSWTVTQGSGTLSGASTITNEQGEAQATVTLGSTPGALVVRVTSGSGTTAAVGEFNLTVTVSVAGINAISGGGQVAVIGQSFGNPLVVQVLDDRNLPIPGAPVAFSVVSGSATFGTANAIADAQGFARTTVIAGGNAGPIVIRATSGNRTTDFTLTARNPGPGIDVNSFRNAASGFAGLTPCGIATVYGSGVATGVQGIVQANPFIGPLPYALANVSVDVNGIPAPIFWVSNTSSGEAVSFQTPCEVTPGPATVTVRVGGGNTTVSNITVTKYQPGIFETVIDGRKFAVLLHDDGSYVTVDNPARRGERLRMFATGLGPVNPGTGTNRTGIGGQFSDAAIAVGVNNLGVRSEKPEYLTGAIGIFVIPFEVPADTQPGPYQNLGLIVSDAGDPNATPFYANGSFLPII